LRRQVPLAYPCRYNSKNLACISAIINISQHVNILLKGIREGFMNKDLVLFEVRREEKEGEGKCEMKEEVQSES